MNIQPTILALLVVAVASLPLMFSLRSFRTARTDLTAAKERLVDAQQHAIEILRLKTRRQRIAERKRPEQDVIARVRTVMAEAGIDVRSHFHSLRPESDAPLPDRRHYRRQSVSVSLSQLALPDIGRFISAWRDSQPLWTPARIELTHARSSPGSFDVTIVFSAIYVDSSGRTS